jgi:hypothetical protein
MSDISLGNYEQNQLQAPNLDKLPAQAPAQAPVETPQAPIGPTGFLPRGGAPALAYGASHPEIEAGNQQMLVGRTAFNSVPDNLQDNIEKWVRLNSHLQTDPTALMALSRESGIPQDKLHAMVSWATLEKPVDVMHTLATAGERFGSMALGSVAGGAQMLANFIPGFANTASKTPTVKEWEKTVDYQTWETVYKLQHGGKSPTPNEVTQEYNNQVNNPNKQAFRQEEKLSNFYTLNSGKVGHALWHDTVGQAMNMATTMIHYPSYVISDTYKNGIGAGVGDVASVLFAWRLMSKLGRENIPKEKILSNYADSARKTIDDYNKKINQKIKITFEDADKFKAAKKFIEWYDNAKSKIDEHPNLEKLGNAIGKLASPIRSGLGVANKTLNDPYLTLSTLLASTGASETNRQLWNATMSGAVIGADGQPETMTSWVAKQLDMEHSFLFHQFEIKGPGGIGFKGGAIELYQYLFQNDPFAAVGKLRKIAKGKYGFTGHLQRWFGGTGIRRPGDATRAWRELKGVRNAVDALVDAKSAAKVLTEFPGQFGKKIAEAFAKANSREEVLSIFEDVTLAQEVILHQMPMLSTFSLWKKALEGDLGRRFGIVGNVFDKTYAAEIYDKLIEQGVDASPQGFKEQDLAAGDKAQNAFRKMLARQFLARAQYYSSKLKSFENKKIFPNDVESLGFIKNMLISGGMDSRAVDITADFLYHTTDAFQWNTAIYNATEQMVISRVASLTRTADISSMLDTVYWKFHDEIWGLLGADGGNAKGAYNFGTNNMVISTVFGPKVVAVNKSQLGSISMVDARTIKAVARTTAKWIAQLNGSATDMAMKTLVVKDTQLAETLADLAKIKVKDILINVREHWSQYSNNIISIHLAEHTRKAYLSKMEELLNGMDGIISAPTYADLSEAGRYRIALEYVQREMQKIGDIKAQIDGGLAERRKVLFDESISSEADLQKTYTAGEAIDNNDLRRLQEILLAENQAARFVQMKFQDVVTEQFDSAANLRKMSQTAEAIADDKKALTKKINNDFAEYWQKAKIGRVYMTREIKRGVLSLMRAAAIASDESSIKKAAANLKESIQRNIRKENPYSLDHLLNDSILTFAEQIVNDTEMQARFAEYHNRLEKLGIIGRNVDAEILQNEKALQEFLDLAEKSPKDAVAKIREGRADSKRFGISMRRDYRNNRELVTDAINKTINVPFKALALAAVSWSTHVSMSEFMLNSLRVGGDNMFNARFAYQAARWEYRFGKLAAGEKSLLANSIGVLFHGIKTGLLESMDEAAKNNLMQDAFYLLMVNDGHLPMGVHGHSTSVDQEAAERNAFVEVHGIDKNDNPSSSRKFETPEWTHIGPQDTGFASAWLDGVKTRAFDELQGPMYQEAYRIVMQEGIDIIGANEESAVMSIIRAAQHIAENGEKAWMIERGEEEINRILDELAGRDEFKLLTQSVKDQLVSDLKAQVLRKHDQVTIDQMTEAAQESYRQSNNFIAENEKQLERAQNEAAVDLYKVRQALAEVMPESENGNVAPLIRKLVEPVLGPDARNEDILQALEQKKNNPFITEARRLVSINRAQTRLNSAEELVKVTKKTRDEHPYNLQAQMVREEERMDFARNISEFVKERFQQIGNWNRAELKSILRSPNKRIYKDDIEMLDSIDPAIAEGHIKFHSEYSMWKDAAYAQQEIRPPDERIPDPITFTSDYRTILAPAWESSIPTYESKIRELLQGTQYPEYITRDNATIGEIESAIMKLPRAIKKELNSSYSIKALRQSKEIQNLVKIILPGNGITRRNPEIFLRNLMDEIESTSTLNDIVSWATFSKRIKPGQWEKISSVERRNLIAEYGQEIKTSSDILDISEKSINHFNSFADDFESLTRVGELLSKFKVDGKRFADKMDAVNSGTGIKRWKSLINWRGINLETVLNVNKLNKEEWGQRLGREFENRYNTYKSPLFTEGDLKKYTPNEDGLQRFLADYKRYASAGGPWSEQFLRGYSYDITPSRFFNNEMFKTAKASERRRLAQDWAKTDEAYKDARMAAQRSRERISKLFKEQPVDLDPQSAAFLESYRETFMKYEASSRHADNLAESMRKAREARDRALKQTFERVNADIKERIEGIESEYGRLVKRSPEQILQEAQRRAAGEKVRAGWSNQNKINFEKLPELANVNDEYIANNFEIIKLGGATNLGFYKIKLPDGNSVLIKLPDKTSVDDINIKDLASGDKNQIFDVLAGLYTQKGTDLNVQQTAEVSQLVSKIGEALDAPVMDTKPFTFVNKDNKSVTGILMPFLEGDRAAGTGWSRAGDHFFGSDWLSSLILTFNDGAESYFYNTIPNDVTKSEAQSAARLLITDIISVNPDRHSGNILRLKEDQSKFIGIDHDNGYWMDPSLDNVDLYDNAASTFHDIFTAKFENGEQLFTAQDIIQMDNELKDLHKYGEMSKLQRDLLEFSLEILWNTPIQLLKKDLPIGAGFDELIDSISKGEFPRPVEPYQPMAKPINALREAMMQDLNDKEILDRFGGSPFERHKTAGVDALQRMYGDRVKFENDRISAAYDEASKQVALSLGARKFSGAKGRELLYDSLHAKIEAMLRKMKKSELNRFERALFPLVDENFKDPSGDTIVDFATALTHDTLNSMYSNANNKMIPEILHQAGTKEFTSAKDWSDMASRLVKNTDEGLDAVPHGVPARQTASWWSSAGMKNLIPSVSNWAHEKILGPIVNEMVRSPLFLVEFHNQMNYFREFVANGTMDEDVARTVAQTNAAISMERFVHNPLGKTNFEHNMRVLAPFYFAKNQAIRRAFRMGVQDIAAIDRYMRMNLFMTNFIGVTAANGNTSIAVPGSEMFGTISTSALSLMTALSGTSVMPGESMQMGFNGSAGSVNSMIITGNEAGATQILENFIRVPWGPVVMLPAKFYYEYVTHHSETVRHVLNAVLGADSMRTSFMSDLMPNSFARNAGALVENGLFHHPVGSYMSMENQIGSTVGGQVWQNFYQETVQENPYASGATLRYITDQKWSQYWGSNQAQVKANVSWMTAIAYTWKTLVSEVSPLTVSFNNTWSDSNIYNQMQSERNPDGTLKYPDLTTLFNAFVTQHPGHVFDIISKTQSPYGVWPEVNASLQLIDNHQTEVLQVPYGAAYLIPRTLDTKYSATALSVLTGIGLRQKESFADFSKAMEIAIGDDMYYNILQPEYRQNYPDGKGGISFQGQSVLKNELKVIAEINPSWYDQHTSSKRSNLAVNVYNDMEKMVTNVQYHNLFSGSQLEMFKKFVTLRKEYIDAFGATLPTLRGRLRNEWYNVTTEWYNDPQYAGYQSFISLMRKLPDPA